MYLILFSLNTSLQILAHDLGSVFADLYTSLYIAFDNVLSEEFMCFTCSKDSCANTSFIRSYNSDPRQLSNIPGSLLLLRPKLRSGDDDFINPAEHAANSFVLVRRGSAIEVAQIRIVWLFSGTESRKP